MKYLFLVAAVLSETIGTSALQASNQFTKFWPSVTVVISYALAFYFLSITLKSIWTIFMKMQDTSIKLT
jgi:small multidrug resistance pump